MKERLAVKNKMVIYNFGSPRTGNPRWTDYVMKLFPRGYFFRVTHRWDIVSHTPLAVQNFNHAGTEVWYPGRSLELTHKICYNEPRYWENKRCTNSFFTPGQLSIKDHRIFVGIDFSAEWCSAKIFLEQ